MEFQLLVITTIVLFKWASSAVCNSNAADIVFVLDSSYSIWPPDFDRELQFMANVIQTFDVGPHPNQTRVGAMTFGHEVWPKFYLNSYNDVETIIRAIGYIKYGEGKRTNTGDALEYARDVMLSARAGARENVTKIIIVVSDGLSQKTFFTQNVAKSLQDRGITLFAVSIGLRLDHKELAGIASDPDSQHYFSIDNYAQLTSVRDRIDAKVCGRPEEISKNGTDTGEELPADERAMVESCEEKKADIFFVVDSSYSIKGENFAREMEFVHSIIEMLDIGPNKTRIGVMSFSNTAEFHLHLHYDLKKETYLSHLNSIQYMGGGTDTATALRRMREDGFFSEFTGQRPDAVKIAIVLTDGLSISPEVTAREAKRAKKMGIQIFSVGIGGGIDKRELIDIASEPADKFVLHVDDFGSLMNIKMKLAARSCTVNPVDGLPEQANLAVCHPLEPTDLLFVYDSVSLGSWRSQMISQFVSKSVAELNLASNDLRVGREIENCPDGNIPLGSALQSGDLDSIRFQTFTDMLKRVNRQGFSVEGGGRENSSKMAVVVIDDSQRMNYETFLEAQKLRNNVDFFFLVTIGHNMQILQLTGLAGEGKSISVQNYEDLHGMTDKLMSAMCDYFFTAF